MHLHWPGDVQRDHAIHTGRASPQESTQHCAPDSYTYYAPAEVPTNLLDMHWEGLQKNCQMNVGRGGVAKIAWHQAWGCM
jgi:hypothetical protein